MKKIELSDHFTCLKLLVYSIPAIAMAIVILSFSLVDGYFVSNLLGVTPFAAVEFVTPVFLVLYAIGFLFGSGSSAVIARLIGQEDMDRARQCFSMVVVSMSIVGVIMAVITVMLLPQILILLGVTEEIFKDSVTYGRYLLIFLAFHIIVAGFQSIWVTTGRTGVGFVVSLVNGVTNVVLDWFLITKVKMGVAGAGIATSIGAIVGTVIIIVYFSIKDDSRLYFVPFRFDFRQLGNIAFNGASEMVDTVAENITSLVFNRQLLHLIGYEAVAAMGVYNYVMGVFLSFFYGISSTTVTVVGYKYGRGEKDEINSVLKNGTILSFIFGVIAFAVCIVFADPISELYVGYDKNILPFAIQILKINSLSCIFYGVVVFIAAFFTGLDDGLASVIISFMLSLLVPVVAIYELPIVFGLDAIWFSLPLASVVSVMVCIILLKLRYKAK